MKPLYFCETSLVESKLVFVQPLYFDIRWAQDLFGVV